MVNSQWKEKQHFSKTIVPTTLVYISSDTVIPAPYQVRGKLQQESSTSSGFRVAFHLPGMTTTVKGFLNH
jgi:hypothetical protein